MLPLHIALPFNALNGVIHMLFVAYPEAAEVQNNDRQLSLNYTLIAVRDHDGC